MDAKVRELLRRWHETGDAQDEERYLRARLRLGTLPWVNLELAAYLGDEVARGFLGEDGLALKPQKGLHRFFERLPARCPETYRQVVVAALRGLGRGADTAPEVERGIEAARSWIERPSPEGRQAAAVALIALQGRGSGLVPAACRDVLQVIAQKGEEGFNEWLAPWQRFARLKAKGRVSEVFRSVREYVVPWALALEDPLPEREGWDPQDLPDDPDLRAIYQEYLDEHARFLQERAEARARRTIGGGGREELFTAGRMDPAHAAKVLEAVGVEEARGKKLPVPECKVAIEAYYEAKGWKLKRGSLYAPSNQRRIKLKKRALRIEVGGPGNWHKKASTAGHEILISAHGKSIVDAALASLPDEVLEQAALPPEEAAAKAKAKKAKARKKRAARKAVKKVKPKSG